MSTDLPSRVPVQIPHRPKTLQISGVPARLTAELERLAARRGQTMASYLRGLVYDHLEEIGVLDPESPNYYRDPSTL